MLDFLDSLGTCLLAVSALLASACAPIVAIGAAVTGNPAGAVLALALTGPAAMLATRISWEI